MKVMNNILTVSELNRSVRQMLEQGFPLMWVAGEISNFTRAASGHWYFSLKDPSASVRCVMFRQKNQYLDWVPKDGMQVEARALVTLYEAKGEFQLGVEGLRRSGQGAAFEAFLRLKEKLSSEGLFDQARKKRIPFFPRRIGVVTSLKAAALQDILKTLRRRMPSIPVLIYPAAVQGEGAAAEIAQAIEKASSHDACDVLILARGGGSIEDIAAFNAEIVARAVADCPIPIVCGVGHETDFTIADFVADVRAPTPTGAAEIASPDREDLARRLGILHARMRRMARHGLESRMQHVDHLGRRIVHPSEKIAGQHSQLKHLSARFDSAWRRQLEQREWQVRHLSQRLSKPDLSIQSGRTKEAGARLASSVSSRFQLTRNALLKIAAHLEHLNPSSVLARGYSMVQKKSGEIVLHASQVSKGEEVGITFGKGCAEAMILSADQCS